MNYSKIHDEIIERGRGRILEGYTERHHIIPKCMGGTDDESNLVNLTPEEHYVVHQLLVKIYPDVGKLKQACFLMGVSNVGKRNNKQYGWVRRRYIEYLKNDEDRKTLISNRHKGKTISEETRDKMSKYAVKRNSTDEWKNMMREKITGKRYSCDVNMKKGRSGKSNAMYGKTHTEDALNKIREANSKKVICPYCSKEGGIAIMKRWHFENCRQK